jgi:hypothetical protein
MAHFAKRSLDQLAALVKRRLKRMRHRHEILYEYPTHQKRNAPVQAMLRGCRRAARNPFQLRERVIPYPWPCICFSHTEMGG